MSIRYTAGMKRLLPITIVCMTMCACTTTNTANVSMQAQTGSNVQAVPQDPASAVGMYTNRAFQGDAAAQAELGIIYEKGLGVVKDPVTAYAWFLVAADQKDDDGKIGLQRLSQVLTPEQIDSATKLHDQFTASMH